MTLRLPSLCLALLALTSPVAAADQTWTVIEGQGGGLTGIWHLKFNGSAVTGNAEMVAKSGQKVLYQIVGRRNDGMIEVQRGNPTDRMACAYRGRIEGNRITGSALCGAAQAPWSAIKK